MTTQVVAVPKWLIILRGLQLLFAIIVLGLSAYGVYWIAFNSWGFAIFTSLFTAIVVLYGILTTRITAWNKGYNYWAIVALDAVGVIFWLSAMGSLAATRAIFVIPTTISGCGHNGSLGGGVCFKRSLFRRAYVATDGYLSIMSGAAGVSAIEFVLFVVTLVFSSLALHRARKAGAEAAPPTNDKLEAHPMENVNQQQHHEVPTQYQQPQAPQQYQQPPQPYQQPPPQQY